MSYLVFCTFDLENATRRDYTNAYADLENIGLSKVIVSDNGNDCVVPTTSTIGKFEGSDAASVRTHVKEQVRTAFKSRNLKSEIFITVGGNWAWGAATT